MENQWAWEVPYDLMRKEELSNEWSFVKTRI
jgi:hypothetical protein